MTVVKRSTDGVAFIVQAYRETLTLDKRSNMLRELRLLAEQQGQFVCLYKKSKQHIEAVISKEEGCLLAEAVWHYFDKPKNLIYCEAFNNSAQMLLVVVRDGSIYLDARILSSSLRDELVPLMSGEHVFRVVTFGDLPLRNVETFGGATFMFPKKLLESFEVLEKPLFPMLPAPASCQLTPLATAIKSEHLGSRLSRRTVSISVFILLLLSWWLLFPTKPHTVLHPKIKQHIASPYTSYEKAMHSQSPDQQIHDLVAVVEQLYVVPGWRLQSMHFNGRQYEIMMKPDGGDLSLLSQWANQHHYDFDMTPNGAQLTLDAKAEKLREHISPIQKIQPILLQLIDRINLILRRPSVEVSSPTLHGKAKQTHLVITMNGISPDLLDLVGQTLTGLPVTLSQVRLEVDSGFIKGTIDVSVWGI